MTSMDMDEVERRARAQGRPWPPPFPGDLPHETHAWYDDDPLAEPAGYGVKVDQTPRPDWRGHDKHTQCDIVRGSLCPNKRTHIVWIGCLREHVGPVCICDQHPDIELVLASLKCKFCLDAGETNYMAVIRKDPAP